MTGTAVGEGTEVRALGPLLALSHDLAWARSEEELCLAVARAIERLFPGCRHAVRFVDPRTCTVTSVRASEPLDEAAAARLALRHDVLLAEGVDPAALEAAGVTITSADEPIFEGSAAAEVVPLAVAGVLHGVVSLEWAAGAPAGAGRDGPVLRQLAVLAALAARNVRSLDELASLKRSLEDLVEHANALIAVADRAGVVSVWNGALARLTGVPRDEALGRELSAFAAPADGGGLGLLLSRTLAGEAVDGHEARLSVRGGGEARVAFNTAPVRGGAGEIEGVVAIGQDVTRLRSLEAAAEQAEKMAGLGRLAAGIVHELNNPLTAVTMYAESLYEKWAFSGGAAGDLEKIKAIKEAGQRIHRLTRDLTAYARPGGGNPEPVDLGPLLDQAARMCTPALKEASASVERSFGEARQVVASRTALVQCFVNLIANAAQALPSGGVVRLGLGEAGGHAVVTVSDDGAGMTEEVRARAFEPFFTTRPGKGIGLGLPTARGIVERHGGTIAVESAPGQGTTVTVSLPVRPG